MSILKNGDEMPMCPRVSDEYKETKKREIAAAARRVFIRKGFAHAVMQDIMDEAGISRGALYAYFDNLEHVFMEVLRYDDEELFQWTGPELQSPVWGMLMKWLGEIEQDLMKLQHSLVRARAEFFLSSAYVKDKKHYPYIRQRYENAVDAISRVIRAGEERGEFQPLQDARSLAGYILSFLNGLMLDTYQLGPDATWAEQQLDVFRNTLKLMLKPSSTDGYRDLSIGE
ncbi:TetR family transcriptional regulator [Paenibacillus lactis]|nr:TetR family transcriptional regulator [Paenibacillus lactis]